jgi:crotonobetaine/carnitine-CoA ligase
LKIYDVSQRKDRILGKVLEFQASTNGDAVWLWSGDRRMSFGEAERRVNRLAHGLHARGVHGGDVVAMVMEPSIEVVLIAFAAAKLGAIFTTINTDYRGDFLQQSLADTKARILIIDESPAERLAPLPSLGSIEHVFVNGAPAAAGNVPALSLNALYANEVTPPVPDSPGHWRDTVQIWWSSGTTGKSKGIMFCHSHLLFLAGMYTQNRIQPGAVLYSCTPMYLGVPWVSIVYPALVAGVVAAIDPRFSVSNFWKRVRHYGATNIHTLGAMHMMLWKQPETPEDRENNVRFAFMIPTPHDLVPKFKARWGIEDLPQSYGTSETYILLEAPDDGTAWEGSAIGRPLPHVQVKLVDDDDQEVASGEIGEICARPKQSGIMFSGYYNEPQRTLDSCHDLWYHTGDMAIKDEAGVFHFADRKKDYVRYKGRNISNFEVEAVIYKHAGVADVAAFGVQSEELDSEQELAICVVAKAGVVIAPLELATFINEHAPYYFVPRYIEFVAELPRNAHGRTLKNELRARGISPTAWDRDRSGFKARR